ncbi:PREDICTED: regulatory solute carrier protein family 1 member 1 [Nanorana parkeri]|uniref:regulatory solute carrier protein family 1 member 1 n=1 Tax=Nanorana parkeri TaxID=125878 RepID=UPI000854FAEF|nr:PREDICTED: regulatory solute carrier protein family 1 member 1 [Nanorana parkeri]
MKGTRGFYFMVHSGQGRHDAYDLSVSAPTIPSIENYKETTSVDRPSLVPPTDGLRHPVHAPGDTSAPPAQSVSTQTSVCPPPSAESSESAIDASAVDAACASQTDHPPQPLGLSDSAESSSSQLSSVDQATGPTVALKDALADFVQAQHRGDPTSQNSDFVQAQHRGDPTSQNSAFVKDHDAELHAGHSPQAPPPALLPTNTEDTMDVDTQTPLAVAAAETCERYSAGNAQPPSSENSSNHPASSDAPGAAISHVDDTPQDGPKPSPGTDVDESCFSLAAALKELHRLLVASGQGPSRATEEPFPPGHPGSLQDRSSEDAPSKKNVTGERDTNGALLCRGPVQKTANSAISEDLRREESNLSEDSVQEERNLTEDSVQEERNLTKDSVQEDNNLSDDYVLEERNLSEDSIHEERNLSEDSIHEERNLSEDSVQEDNNLSEDLMQEDNNLSDDSVQEERNLSEDSVQEESDLCYSDISLLDTADITEPPVSSLPSAEATDVNGNPIQTSPADDGLSWPTSDPEGRVGGQIPVARPTASSPSAVERIVQAGFPLHDARLALERADGNVELALLALLAKNIVVPT